MSHREPIPMDPKEKMKSTVHLGIIMINTDKALLRNKWGALDAMITGIKFSCNHYSRLVASFQYWYSQVDYMTDRLKWHHDQHL